MHKFFSILILSLLLAAPASALEVMSCTNEFTPGSLTTVLGNDSEQKEAEEEEPECD